MPNIGTILKQEIRRLARREIGAATAGLRKDNVRLKRTIAEHKRRLAELEKASSRLISETAPLRAEAAKPTEKELRKARVTAGVVRNLRKRLGLSQAELATLLGVSAPSVYQWEHRQGRLVLRDKTKAAIIAARNIGVREAKRRLEEMEGS